MHQQEKNIKGFNLLELLVVLGIISIISALGYPNFSSWNKEREVRRAAEDIKALMKNIHTQTERGTFAYVQVLFVNDGNNLIVTSKGMTMQSLATKMNDMTDGWNANPNSRCNTSGTNYWDTDIAGDESEIGKLSYSITLDKVTTQFANGQGAVCFSRNGKFYDSSDLLAASGSTPYDFIYLCRRELVSCPVSYQNIEGEEVNNNNDDNDSDEAPSEPVDIATAVSVEGKPTDVNVKYLRAVKWGRFGNFSVSKWNGTSWVE